MDDIKDNPSDTWLDKFNLLEYAGNTWSVDGKNWLLDRAMDDDKFVKRFVHTTTVAGDSEDDNTTTIPWNEDGISKYFKAMEKFKEQLFVLVHLTAGAPACGIEGVTIAYENGVDFSRSPTCDITLLVGFCPLRIRNRVENELCSWRRMTFLKGHSVFFPRRMVPQRG
jgi:hypothetical protein